jgi:tetratricopeptide (TPR) repeat protein
LRELTERRGDGTVLVVPQGDINEYANGLLLRFLDAFHEQMRRDLEERYGDEWLEKGVQRHLQPQYFDRTRQMLESPMRVVDMGKTDDELFGIEHLWNVVAGNWKDIYGPRFSDRQRTEVYFGEIAEVRHNVSHRRRRHFLRRGELARFAQNCAVLLRCAGSPEAAFFEDTAEALSAGASPWGPTLGGYIPPQDEIVGEFVGRDEQLRKLTAWLASDMPQLLVWGYGGAGKSALAYEFAREAKEIAPADLNAVAWISAKSREYVEGRELPKRADFTDKVSLVVAVFNAVYDTDLSGEPLTAAELVEQLHEMPVLLVVDDFDTVLGDDDLIEFLMHDLRATGSRTLYTSRQKVAGLRSIEVLGFDGAELAAFVRFRADEHGLDPAQCDKRVRAIHSVTGGFPLFVDDLLRYARLSGIDDAIGAWSQRKGDAAREYALRRQLEQLGETSKDVLISLAVADRSLTTLEMATMAGLTDDDAEHAIRSLLDWRLVNRVPTPDEKRPGFSVNSNTARLVQQTYGKEPRIDGFRSKFKALRSTKAPAARTRAVASAIGIARSLVIRGDVHSAVEVLQERMTGELADSAELWGALGWTYSRLPDEFFDEARTAFERAYDLGNTKEDTYYHWASMERAHAEASVGRVPEDELLDGWRRCARVAELGVKICGVTKPLCQLAGYAHTREAKTLERLNEFMQANGAYAEAADWLRKALAASASPVKDVPRELIYRGLVLALEGTADQRGLEEALGQWAELTGNDDIFQREYDRLYRRFPSLGEPSGAEVGIRASDGAAGRVR